MPSSALSSAEQSRRNDGEKRSVAIWLTAETLFVFLLTFLLAATAVKGDFASAITASAASRSDASSVWGFLAAFASATALVLILLRKPSTTRLFEIVFLFAVFTGIGSLLFSLVGAPVAVIGTSASVLLYYKGRTVAMFDLLLLVGCAGIAANLGGGMRPTGVAIILAVLTVYDIIAVYVTGHMVGMAEGLLRRKAFFAMILPERPSGLLLPAVEATPGGGFMFLGTGDLVLPALLVASTARYSLRGAAFVAVGAFVGVVLLHVVFLSQKERRPMPALPPIAACALLGFLATFFI